jgi:K+-sensing histidine kinase KdpD
MTSPARLKPGAAVSAGTAGVVLVAVVLVPFGKDLPRAAHALLLMVPVVAIAILGGRKAAVAIAVEASLVFAMFLPPIGSPEVELGTDLIALGVFVVVAAAMGASVASVVATERQRLAAEHERLEALQWTEQQRKALLRSVSHDLRTPLATIQAAVSELSSEAQHGEVLRAELLDLVHGETERLDRIVANLLSLSRIEAGALLPNRQTTGLEELVRLSVSRLQRALGDTRTEIVVDGEIPDLEVDYSQIDQVVTNLIENAARHTPPGGTVRIELASSGEAVELTVSDDGPGFPEVLLPRVFEPFATADGSSSSGIGLAICRSIVEAHGGTITACNAPGGGAVVRAKLPI